MANQANHLSATYLTVMYESRTQSNYNQYCFSVKSPPLAFVVVVSVRYLVARMEGRNGDQMYLLKVENVIAFASRRPLPPDRREPHLHRGSMFTHVCEYALNRSLPMQVPLRRVCEHFYVLGTKVSFTC